MRSAETYTFTERPSSQVYSIKITSGIFAGVIYSYGKVALNPPTLKFDFTIEESPDNLPEKLLLALPEFKNLVGDILHDLLELHAPIES